MEIRSFLAFDINDALKKELGQLIELLEPKAKGFKWLKPDNMHCTLKFFGNIDEDLLLGDISKNIQAVLDEEPPLDFVGVGVGVFPNWRYPRVIWTGLTGDVEQVICLHAKLEEKFLKFNIQKDPRAFRLHLTIGRTKSALKNPEGLVTLLEKLAGKEFGSIHVDNLVLYKSELTKDGPIYTALKTFSLRGNKKEE
ncbi:MAG: RNA 2',3'-cyclic phosphodiesterase [Pseudomonadota bacterium]